MAKIDLPSITGQIPHDVEQAIQRLREGVEQALELASRAHAVASVPSPHQLTLAEISAALSPTGSHPVATAAALNADPPPSTPASPPGSPEGETQPAAPDAYIDVCADGTRVTCNALQAGVAPSVTFESDPPIEIPSNGQFLWAESGAFGHLAIVQGLDSTAYLIDRASLAVTNLGPVYGRNAVGIRQDGTPVWQDSATTYQVGGVSTPIPATYVNTLNGFLALDDIGNPIWTDAQITNPIVIIGITFGQASTDGKWTVGISAVTSQYVVYNSDTMELFLAGFIAKSQIAPRITQLPDGSAVISRSVPTFLIYSDSFAPYAVPPPPSYNDGLRGQFCIRGDYPYGPRANQPNNTMFVNEMAGIFQSDQNTCIRVKDAYTGRLRLNHAVFGPAWSNHGYDNQYPTTNYIGRPEQLVDFLRWWGNSFTLMILPDTPPYFNGDRWDIGLIEADLSPIYTHPDIQALTTRVCLAYETVVSIANFVPAFDYMLATFPNAKRFWHNPPGHLSPGLSDEDEQACWRSAAAHGVDGLIMQASPPGSDTNLPPIDQMAYDLWDIRRRFIGVNSPWGAPILNLQGDPLTTEYGEGVAYAIYHDPNIPESIGTDWGIKARTVEGIINTLDGAPPLAP